jgi:hypothetical protein
MDDLSMVYKGDTIYVPEKLKVFIEPWLDYRSKGQRFQQQGEGFQKRPTGNSLVYGSKKVMFFCEDALVKAYKKTPLPHMPETIGEEPFIIEFTLEPEGAKTANGSSKPWQHGVATAVNKKKKKGGKLW